MKLTKKTTADVLKVYDTWLHSYLNADVATYDKYLDDAYHFIGSTQNEEFLNRKDTTLFFEATADQLAGKCELKNEKRTLEKFGELVFVTHLFDAWFLNGTDWSYYGRFRFTSALQEKKEGWRFIYQHFSTTDAKAEAGETIGFDQVSAENLQLKEAIKRRTFELEAKNRALEVEGALERIRAQAVAMKQSSDLLDIVVTMRNEFTKLGHEAHYFWHMMWLPDTYEKAMTSGDGARIGMVMKLPRDFHGKYEDTVAWEKSKEPIHILAMDADTAVDYIDRMITLGNFQQVDPKAPSLDDIRHIGGLTFIMARTTHGEIGYSLPGVVKQPPAEDLKILEQFAGAFDLAHRRFLDLQKAEAQAREVQIELALEKVRSRTMAMQESEELAEVATVLFQQVKELGIQQWTCGFNIWATGDTEFTFFPGGPDGELLPSCKVPLMEHPIFRKFDESRRRGDELMVYEKQGEIQKDHYRYMHSQPGIGDMLQGMLDQGFEFPDYQIDHVVNFAYGNIVFITYEPFPEMHDVFIRFAKVFEQTYTRFLDLQKAEAQARESQIEAALERVRGRALAMHQSEELLAVIQVVSEQLLLLNLSFDTVSFGKNNQEGDFKFWLTSSGQPKPVLIEVPFLNSPVLKSVITAQKKGLDFIADVFSPTETKAWSEHLIQYSVLKNFPQAVKDFILHSPGFARSSFLMQHIDLYIGNYRAVPFTDEENAIFKRFAQVFAQAYTRFLDLQKAEAQAREAEIELALERVRARSMAMQSSEEFVETSDVMLAELKKLKMNAIRIGICTIDAKTEASEIWSRSETKERLENKILGVVPKGVHPVFDNMVKAWKKKQPYFTDTRTGKEVKEYYKKLLPYLSYPLPKTYNATETISTFFFQEGALNVVSHTPLQEDDIKIMIRFSQVFGQVYRRFLDLQKAEAQAREAQIEASLERVRSQAMAMRQSDDLVHCTSIVFDELEKLNLSIERSGIGIFDPETKDCELWTTVIGQDGKKELATGITSLTVHPMLIETFNAWEKQQPYSYILEGKELEAYYKLVTQSDFVLSEDVIEKSTALPKEYYHYSPFGAGGLYFFSDAAPTEGDKLIIRRFAEVFDLTYTRYEDLQKAEAQAREAQIEAALERVRSKAMAMRSSEDIGEATTILFKEIEKLEIENMRCGILIIHDTKVMDVWTTSSTKDDGIVRVSGQIDMTIHPLFKKVYRGWEAQESHTEYELQGKDGEAYYQALAKEAHYQLPSSSVVKEKHYNTCFMFNEGALFAFTKNQIPADALNIFKRFAKVFGLTYQRYRELIESEKREKEAKKQSSLDRVRGEIASMRSTEDLNRITPIIWQELTNLGVPFFRCGIFIMHEDNTNIQVYLSDPHGKSLGLMNLDFATNALTRNAVEAWRKHQVYKAHWSKEEFTNWTKTLIDLGKIKTKKGYQGGDDAPESLDLHFVPFSQGMLYVGNLEPLTEEQIELVVNLSESFSIAYARYEDFNKLEKAKENVEEALTELKSAQNQLIQSEKMASLGELTAGIAHEIQNPLNFVNNFSEVSKELLEEMMEEMAKGDMEEVKAIADDIIQNLDKINHHGKRADGIVKGMLQHSRSSSGKKEPTDINILADEYLRLAYHGLRAKDPSFNATLETDYDPTIVKINVIPQDLGRVMLNLITNAFYAASERKKTAKDPAFMPTVSVRTKQKDHQLIISVQDNGQGIPKKVLDKIFQPFFTTKPTGEGTGLGLSMSYDIVTKGHGGEIKVETRAGEGTTFYVNLPVTK